jgi:hypothetical protein
MRRFTALALALIALTGAPAAAQVVTQTVTVTYEFEVSDTGTDDALPADPGSDRFVAAAPTQVPHGIARFGPFRVIDPAHAALVDATDETSPAHFAAMVRAYPGIATLEMIECPGTYDDRANLQLGRMIHARGIATHVPKGGSVRSGAVELFLAGKSRVADTGAEFAVHSWADDTGREAKDYPADAPENRAYISYYEDMGMPEGEARAFYAMTNSVPNAQAKWFGAAEMGHWVTLN